MTAGLSRRSTVYSPPRSWGRLAVTPIPRSPLMLNAAIVGLGRWGQNLVNSVQGKSSAIRFTAGATRTVAKAADYAREKGFPLHDSFEKILADPDIDAIVLATPHTQHARQVVAAAK